MIGPAELERRFPRHTIVSQPQDLAVDEISELTEQLAARVDELAADSREKSLAITALEEFSFWSAKAIITVEESQK
jgi:hypothetical protein